LVITD